MVRFERTVLPEEYVAEKLVNTLAKEGISVTKEEIIHILRGLPEKKLEFLIVWLSLRDYSEQIKHLEELAYKLESEGKWDEAWKQREYAYTLRDKIRECYEKLKELGLSEKEVFEEIYAVLKKKPTIKPEEKPRRVEEVVKGKSSEAKYIIYDILADLISKFLKFIRSICDRFYRIAFRLLTDKERKYVDSRLREKPILRRKPFNIGPGVINYYEEYWFIEYMYDNYVVGPRLTEYINRVLAHEPIDNIKRELFEKILRELVIMLFNKLPRRVELYKDFRDYVLAILRIQFPEPIYSPGIEAIANELERRIIEMEERRARVKLTPIEKAVMRAYDFLTRMYAIPEPFARIIRQYPLVKQWVDLYGYPILSEPGILNPQSYGSFISFIKKLQSFGIHILEPKWEDVKYVDKLIRYIEYVLTHFGEEIKEKREDAYWYLIAWLETLRQLKGG